MLDLDFCDWLSILNSFDITIANFNNTIKIKIPNVIVMLNI